jgi:hypothetical protein
VTNIQPIARNDDAVRVISIETLGVVVGLVVNQSWSCFLVAEVSRLPFFAS